MPRIGDYLDDVTYPVRRGARRVGDGAADAWYDRSLSFRRRIAAATGLVVLYLLLKVVVAPALPCSLPGGDECPPASQAAKLVPADALLYGHLDVGTDSEQFTEAQALARRFPHSQALLQSAVGALKPPSGAQVDLQRDVRPWLGDEAAIARLPGAPGAKKPAKSKDTSALLLGTTNPNAAVAFADKVGGTATAVPYQGLTVRSYGKGFASALVNDFLAIGDVAAVRRVVDTAKAPSTSIDSAPAAAAVRDPLPTDRFADVYISQQGVRTLLADRGGYAGQLDTFADFSATKAIAGSARAKGDGVEFQLESDLDPALASQHPAFFAAFPPFDVSLSQEVSEQALVYVGVSKLGSGLGALLKAARKTAPGLAKSLQGFQNRLADRAKLDIARELVPLLDGETAFAIEPTAAIPYAALIVDGVTEKEAGTTIAKLAVPIAKAASGGGNIAGSLTQTQIDGVTASSIRLSPSVNLTFAAFDGKLVVATDPAGVKEARSGKDSLSGSDQYKRATEQVGDDGSALVFLNLESLFGLAERAGLAEDPDYATFSEDIAKLQALGIGVSSDNELLTTRFFLTIE